MGRGVLVTRPEPGASETARRLRAMHLLPVLAPLLQVRHGTLTFPRGIAAVLVSSANAVPALPDMLRDTLVLAVGDTTAARARDAGFAQVMSADGDAAALVALTERACRPGGPVLLATGRGQGGALAAALRGRGFVVHRRVAYAAQAVPVMPAAALAAIGDGTLTAALFLSADTARAFVRLLPSGLSPMLGTVTALAIGAPAAEALCGLPWQNIRVSAKPTQESILAML